MEGNQANVLVNGEELTGRVEAVHGSGEKIDVRIDHPGSKHHGRVVTLPADEVEVIEPKAPKNQPSPADLKAFARGINERFEELEEDVQGLKNTIADLEAKLAVAIASINPPNDEAQST